MASRYDVQEWVRDARSLPIKGFYPTAPAKATGLALATVWAELVQMAAIGWVNLRYEVCCPGCAATVKKSENPDPTSLYDDESFCSFCGEAFEISADSVIPFFEINTIWAVETKKEKAVTGKQTLPSGGGATLRALSNGEKTPGVIDLSYPGVASQLRSIADLLDNDPDTKGLVQELKQELSEVPKNKSERRQWLSRFSQTCENLKKPLELLKMGRNAWLSFEVYKVVEKAPALFDAVKTFISGP